MHKNAYTAKTLNGNWWEDRYQDKYDEFNNKTSNTYLANPSYNKYVPTSRGIGNSECYDRVSPPISFPPAKIRRSHPKLA